MVKAMKQPNGWSCYPVAVCMLTGIDYDKLIRYIGHDGSKVLDRPGPWNREAFISSEVAYALLRMGWAVVPLLAAVRNEDGSPRTAYPPWHRLFNRIAGEGWKAVVVVKKPDREHALAYDGETGRLFDPLTGEETALTAEGPPVQWVEILVPIQHREK